MTFTLTMGRGLAALLWFALAPGSAGGAAVVSVAGLGVHTTAPPPLLPGADTPPRGLNTWDSFRYWASERDLVANAKAMNESGLVEAGWQYLVVDEGWYRWSNNTSVEQEQHRTVPTPNAVRNQSWAGYNDFDIILAFWSISRVVVSPPPPQLRRVLCSSACPP